MIYAFQEVKFLTGNSIGKKFVVTCFGESHGKCVGVAKNGEKILLTNTKKQNIIIEFTVEEWDAFTKGVKAGEFDNITG